MADWGANAVASVTLTKEQYSNLCDKIVEHGKGRKKEHGKRFHEDDFLCGAMACMEALGISCPVWVLMLVTGRKVIE